MLTRIQAQVPYQDCLRWQIHSDYFQQRGFQAFSSHEVPAYITSNYHAARQLARLVLSALDSHPLGPGESLRLLETAGGSGWFAWNFIRAFDDLCREQGRRESAHLEYLLTDASRASLAAIQANPGFAALLAQGRLKLYLLDMARPAQLEDLAGTRLELPLHSLAACFTNYGHCTLPAMILRKADGRFYERQVSLLYPAQVKPASIQAYRQDLLVEEESFEPIELAERVSDAAARRAMETLLADFDQATLLYAPASWASIRQTLPLLRRNGLMLISDKATIDAAELAGHQACRFSIHGNSIAHYTPFPLLAAYAAVCGGKAINTQALPDELQTLMIAAEPAFAPPVAQTFKAHFLELNLNLLLCSLKSACQSLYRQGDLAGAAKHYAKLLAYDPQNAEGTYVLAQHMLAEGHFEWALRSLATPHDDLLQAYNFDLLRGLASEGLSRFAAAREAYLRSLASFSEELEAWCGLIRTELALGDTDAARKAYAQALARFPDAPSLQLFSPKLD